MRTPAISSPLNRSRALVVGALAAFGLAATALFAQAAPASAHDQLVDTVVVTDEAGAATAVQMSFNNNLIAMGSEIAVTDANDTSVTSAEPEVTGRDITQKLETPLADGDYTVAWRVNSSDGHPIEGGFSFDVTDGKPGDIVPLEGAEDHHDESEGDSAEATDHEHAEESGFPTWAKVLLIAAPAILVAALTPVFVSSNRKRKAAAASAQPANAPEQE